MNDLDTARKNCTGVLAAFYHEEFGLLADMLGDAGEYRSFWLTPNGTVLAATSDDVFDGQAFTCIYELQCKRPLGWPIAS